MLKRVIGVNGRDIPLDIYVRGVRFAIQHPDTEFKTGLGTWWSTTGREIQRQFLASIHDRINQAVPYSRRGL